MLILVGLIGPQEMLPILVIVLVIVVIFGAKRLPELARSMGRSITEFKKGTKEISDSVESAGTEKDQAEDGESSKGKDDQGRERP